MRVTEKLEPGKPFAIVLTGDGIWERRLLSGLAPEFNGDKLLFFPPPRGRTGFSALRALREFAKPELMPLGKLLVLFLIDREHFRTQEPADELGDHLRAMGMDVKRIRQLPDGALLLDISVGQKELHVFVAILGEEKSLEENIACLLRELGHPVRPDKKAIRAELKKMGKRLEDLVSEALKRSRALVRTAFSTLTSALEALEAELDQR